MEIIKNFGINWYLLGAQIVNFLILFYLLKRFAYKPIFKMLVDRRKMITEGIKNSQESKIALDRSIEEEKKILKKAQESANQILLDAKTQADALNQETRDHTKQQVEQMLIDAKKQIEQNTKQMEKQLALSTAKLAVEMLKDSVKGTFTDNEQKEVITKLTKNLKIA